MSEVSRGFVPSVSEDSGTVIGLGVFSSEETAWSVLRAFLRKSHLMELNRSSIVVWDVDVVGNDGMNTLSSMHCRDCPVCKRRTFWVDVEHFSAMCTGTACEAWIEESTIEPGIIDFGWPPTRFLKQSQTIEEALTDLRKLGVEIEAAGNTPDQTITSFPEV